MPECQSSPVGSQAPTVVRRSRAASTVAITPYVLPSWLVQVAELCGVAVALKMAEELGGTWVYFPGPRTKPRRGNRLIAAIGADATQILANSHEFGGQRLKIPCAVAVRRWKFVREARLKGKSDREISKRLIISIDDIRRLTAGMPKKGRGRS